MGAANRFKLTWHPARSLCEHAFTCGYARSGKDPRKTHKCGVLRARWLAKQRVQGEAGEANVTSEWAPVGMRRFSWQQ